MHHDCDCAVWMRQARLARDMTQDGLAEAVGCASQTVRSFENGRRRPSREMAARRSQVMIKWLSAEVRQRWLKPLYPLC